MDNSKLVLVEVAYALPNKQMVIPVKIEEGSTVYDAVLKSGIKDQFSQINLEKDPMGIFGKMVKDPRSEPLKAGDRVEIYRPLLVDPKASRAKRADKAKQEKVDTTE
ncbi:MAG: RnfH family protein [Pseudomonadales bacterium]|nr:RnfH family protein [Pseudomonadales bacterium]